MAHYQRINFDLQPKLKLGPDSTSGFSLTPKTVAPVPAVQHGKDHVALVIGIGAAALFALVVIALLLRRRLAR